MPMREWIYAMLSDHEPEKVWSYGLYSYLSMCGKHNRLP